MHMKYSISCFVIILVVCGLFQLWNTEDKLVIKDKISNRSATVFKKRIKPQGWNYTVIANGLYSHIDEVENYAIAKNRGSNHWSVLLSWNGNDLIVQQEYGEFDQVSSANTNHVIVKRLTGAEYYQAYSDSTDADIIRLSLEDLSDLKVHNSE